MCKDYQDQIKVPYESFLTAVQDGLKGASVLANVHAIATGYIRNLQTLNDMVLDLENRVIPADMAPVFMTDTCQDNQQGCPESNTKLSSRILQRYSKVLEVGLKEPSTLMIHIMTPCAAKAGITGEYRFFAMPYKDKVGELRRLDIPQITTGIKFRDDPVNDTWAVTPVTCTRQSSQDDIYPCHEISNRWNDDKIEGGREQLTIKAVEEPVNKRFQIENLPRNQYLVYTDKDTQLISKCPGKQDKRMLLRGLMMIQLGFKCNARIPEYREFLESSAQEEFQWKYDRTGTPVDQQNLMIKPINGYLKPSTIAYLWYLWRQGGAYIIIAVVTGGIVLTLGTLVCVTKIMTRVRRPQRRRETTYVTTNRA